mmetsp:Transcript_8073/g.16263  ORF Transcript_8073/g.16263 Transcript_8073/m.16263 type:complete len:92 (+) Transcript_8073:120-395(+)
MPSALDSSCPSPMKFHFFQDHLYDLVTSFLSHSRFSFSLAIVFISLKQHGITLCMMTWFASPEVATFSRVIVSFESCHEGGTRKVFFSKNL